MVIPWSIHRKRQVHNIPSLGRQRQYLVIVQSQTWICFAWFVLTTATLHENLSALGGTVDISLRMQRHAGKLEFLKPLNSIWGKELGKEQIDRRCHWARDSFTNELPTNKEDVNTDKANAKDVIRYELLAAFHLCSLTDETKQTEEGSDGQELLVCLRVWGSHYTGQQERSTILYIVQYKQRLASTKSKGEKKTMKHIIRNPLHSYLW